MYCCATSKKGTRCINRYGLGIKAVYETSTTSSDMSAVATGIAATAASGASGTLVLIAALVLLAAVMAPPIVSRLARKGGGS